MDLNELYSEKRTGVDDNTSANSRTEYKRDFDRIVFSSAFRRLQNKTQVFPLPGSAFVHNRLTHSLEVSCVGRSLGTLVGQAIIKERSSKLNPESVRFYKNHFKGVLSAACLCHDIGNPAFGHSGEDAIANYFKKNNDLVENLMTDEEYEDLINFEGNANSIRILTHNQKGKLDGGLRLTYTTLASIAKYPCESTGKWISKSNPQTHRKKFGFFQAEKTTFLKIAESTGMLKDDNNDHLGWYRHPFVWLVEAADDICYHIIDLEDAHRVGIIGAKQCEKLLINVITCLDVEDIGKFESNLAKINNENARITYLRAKTINSLTHKAKDAYIKNLDKILNGTHNESLFDLIGKDCNALGKISQYSCKNIYNHRGVVEIENAGYHVMYELLNHFIGPILKNKEKRTQEDKKALKLIPGQFDTIKEDSTPYERVLTVVDYLSGMTDLYATELYKKIKGIKIGMNF